MNKDERQELERQIAAEEACVKSHQEKAEELRKRLKEPSHRVMFYGGGVVTLAKPLIGWGLGAVPYTKSREDCEAMIEVLQTVNLAPFPGKGERWSYEPRTGERSAPIVWNGEDWQKADWRLCDGRREE